MSEDNKAMPDLIEPLIGPVTTLDPHRLMKNKEIVGSRAQADFLQCGMPQLRLPIGRMSNPDIQKIMHDLRKNSKQKPNAAARRAAKIAAGKLRVVDGKLFGYEHQFICGDKVYGIDGKEHPDNDPNFDWAALQRLRKSGEGLY